MADTLINATPIVLNDFDFEMQIEGDSTVYDYGAAVSSAEFQSTPGSVTWKGGKPGSQKTFATTPTWNLAVTYADDLTTTNSLTNVLLANQGKSASVVFRPKSGGIGWGATVNLVPGGLGGAVDAVGSHSVTLGVQGSPVVVAAGAPVTPPDSGEAA